MNNKKESKQIKRIVSLLMVISLWAGVVCAQLATDREYWVETTTRIVEPVFVNLSQNTLRQNMPVEINGDANRVWVTHLEALGRSFAGIAPWLNLGADDTAEGQLRAWYIDLCVKSIANAVNPESPDYLRFDGPGDQPVVDAAFFAHGLLRSKEQVWSRLDTLTRERVIESLQSSRKIKVKGVHESNWLLFAAMVEATLLELTGDCIMEHITYAIDRHKEWYKGDGWYGDGRDFHFDYYNSFVIQPMLVDVTSLLKSKGLPGGEYYDTALARFRRYADQQEKLISPEGTFPVLGRSMAYRFGAFHALAQAAQEEVLPDHIRPAQVRCALTAVMKRQLVPDTFDKNGWLQLGFCGHQTQIAEGYISTGSLYLCTFVFLPLGLPANNSFWADEAEDWSSKKIWSGREIPIDYSLKN